MAVLVDGFRNAAADTLQIVFTAGSGGARIQAFTAKNTTDHNVTFTAAIFASGATTGDTMGPAILVRDKANPGFELVNHEIPPGGTLQVESSEIGSVEFRVTGKIL